MNISYYHLEIKNHKLYDIFFCTETYFTLIRDGMTHSVRFSSELVLLKNLSTIIFFFNHYFINKNIFVKKIQIIFFFFFLQNIESIKNILIQKTNMIVWLSVGYVKVQMEPRTRNPNSARTQVWIWAGKLSSKFSQARYGLAHDFQLNLDFRNSGQNDLNSGQN